MLVPNSVGFERSKHRTGIKDQARGPSARLRICLFFLAREVPEGIIDSFQIAKSNNLRPKKRRLFQLSMLIDNWNKKFPQRGK